MTDGWQYTLAGKREVKIAVRKTLFKYKLHQDNELFERAYGYIRECFLEKSPVFQVVTGPSRLPMVLQGDRARESIGQPSRLRSSAVHRLDQEIEEIRAARA